MEELIEIRKSLERRIENYFGDNQKFTGDMGYQDLLEDLENVEEQIEQLDSEKQNHIDNLHNNWDN